MAIFRSKNDTGGTDMLIVGRIAQDIKFGEVGANRIPKIQFSVNVAPKNYINVSVIGNSQQLQMASKLERDDIVMCIGLWNERHYTAQNGEEKVWKEIKIDDRFGMIVPQCFQIGGEEEEQAPASESGYETDEDYDLPF